VVNFGSDKIKWPPFRCTGRIHPRFVLQPLERSGWRLRSTTGHDIPFYGPVSINNKFKKGTFTFSLFVATIVDDCLLGMEFSQHYNASIDIQTSTIALTSVDGVTLKVPFQDSTPAYTPFPLRYTCVSTLRTCTHVTVLKDTEHPVPVEAPKSCRNGHYVITPIHTHRDPLLTTVRVENWTEQPTSGTPIIITNSTNRDRSLLARTAVAECLLFPSSFQVLSVFVEREETQPASGSGHPEPLCHLLSNTHVENDEQKRKVEELLRDFTDIFSCNDEIGCTNLVQHRIDTGNTAPIKQAPRRLPIFAKAEVDKCMKQMLDLGVIEKCSGEWSSPIVLVKKKDGSTRFCIDYRELNSVSRKDAYPLPNIQDTLIKLEGSTLF